MNKKVDAILSPNFVEEMLKLAFANRAFAAMVIDNLDLSNFPRELGGCKAMLKVLSDEMNRNGNLATLGMVEMTYPNNKDVLKKIEDIKNLKTPDYEPMVQQLETFIKRQTFVAVQRQVSDMYNEGKPDEAMALLEKRMYEINSFSLERGKGKFTRIYRDLMKDVNSLQMEAEDEQRRTKIPIGITTLDEITDGGVPRQDTALFIMRSGVGKSTWLRYVGWYNTSIAHNHVLHVQLEGGRKEVTAKYDQMLANTTYSKIMKGNLSEDTYKRLKAIVNRAITVNSDIDVYSSDEMMDTTISDLVSAIEDYKKEYGYYPDLIAVDSIDLMLTGENKKIDFDPNFIKYRLQKIAQRFKDIAKTYDCVVWTVAQTGDIPFELWNNPQWVITRQHTEGDRTLIKPFSFVFTGNATLEEGKAQIARIYCDKLRNYKNNGIIARIPTNYENGFFYDLPRSTTVEQILDMSALEKLESKRGKKSNGESVVGDRKERVEIEPGVWVTQVVKGNEEVVSEPEEIKEERAKRESLKAWRQKKVEKKPIPRKKS